MWKCQEWYEFLISGATRKHPVVIRGRKTSWDSDLFWVCPSGCHPNSFLLAIVKSGTWVFSEKPMEVWWALPVWCWEISSCLFVALISGGDVKLLTLLECSRENGQRLGSRVCRLEMATTQAAVSGWPEYSSNNKKMARVQWVVSLTSKGYDAQGKSCSRWSLEITHSCWPEKPGFDQTWESWEKFSFLGCNLGSVFH